MILLSDMVLIMMDMDEIQGIYILFCNNY
jgi:hypothetical protein